MNVWVRTEQLVVLVKVIKVHKGKRMAEVTTREGTRLVMHTSRLLVSVEPQPTLNNGPGPAMFPVRPA